MNLKSYQTDKQYSIYYSINPIKLKDITIITSGYEVFITYFENKKVRVLCYEKAS